MSDRAKQVILGLLFWLAFMPVAVLTIVLQPIFILLYACGRDGVRPWVYRTGKAMDQLDNAALFGGNPKETISSHAGRWMKAEQEGSVSRAPAWAYLIMWVTDRFEQGHCIKAIEEPFKDQPL